MSGPLVLGIETSCDETGAGLVRGHELLADAVASSVDEHARFGPLGHLSNVELARVPGPPEQSRRRGLGAHWPAGRGR